MTTSGLLAVDLLVSVVAAAAWLGAGAAAVAHRPRLALGLFAGALVASLGRVASIVALAGAGWWFVQDKVAVAGPLLVVAGGAAAVLAGPHLVTAARSGSAAGSGPAAGARARVGVSLFTAGYAAIVGPVVALLFGYPATWSLGLIAAALVGVAALVTRRVVGAAGSSAVTRGGVVAVLATGLLGVWLAVLPGGDVDAGGGAAHAAAPVRAVTALRGPTEPAPGGTIRRYTLTARTGTVTLASGRRVAAWMFNGQVPGPPITATEGDLIEVTLRNADIKAGVTLHWHGYDVPAADDGAPGLTQDAVKPGQEYTYRFLADQVGTYWYHTHEVSDQGVKLGLYGSLVVNPRSGPTAGVDLTLPVHTFAGTVSFGDQDRPIDQVVAAGTPVRLRLVNTDSTPVRFTLAGTGYRLVAVDGTDLNQPGELTRVGLRLAAGGRYDLAFTMPAGPVTLLAADNAGTGLRLHPPGTAVPTRIDGTAGWPDLDLTRYGAPAATPFDARSRVDRQFTLVLDRGLALAGVKPQYAYTVNGHAFPSVPTELVSDGDLVRMTVVNRSFVTHPWHLHGHRVLVLSRNGRPVTGGPLWMDTFDARPGEVWQVAFRANNPGMWMNHCHNLGHAAQGMALHLGYAGIGTPFHGAHGG
jgi:FtsP/CotA-like multicopper oxidase with cupredoxin domain